ncbi:hypothetical protein [Clostridium sp. ZBS18]|uniref:phage lytic cycle repressor MrpR family protein n=1 Tax=Clostridium sp. ZBS18 TaxID=2949967 RepID=UPI00207A0C83|nr:hypothetical protein [Clostridium sp. ZBS18]
MYEFLNNISYTQLNKYQKNKATWLENEKYSKSTKLTYWILMNKNICPIEVQKSKDLRDFTDEEIQEVLNGSKSNNIKTITSLKSIIHSYIKGNDKNRTCCDITATTNVEYQSLNEFYNMIDNLKCSDVDKMLLVLARYGVSNIDVSNIQWNDVDKYNMVIKFGKLNLPIDNKFLYYLDRAYNCNSYDYKTSTIEYIDYGYIIKVSNKSDKKQLNNNTISTRIHTTYKNNGIKRVSITNLNVYRQFDLLFDILKVKGKITYEDVRNVLSIFYEKHSLNKEQYLKERFTVLNEQ